MFSLLPFLVDSESTRKGSSENVAEFATFHTNRETSLNGIVACRGPVLVFGVVRDRER
jgi:hypothetical protein